MKSLIAPMLLKVKNRVNLIKKIKMINKVVKNIDQALKGVHGNMTLFGGFGLSGIPENTIAALLKKKFLVLHVFLITLVLMILDLVYC